MANVSWMNEWIAKYEYVEWTYVWKEIFLGSKLAPSSSLDNISVRSLETHFYTHNHMRKRLLRYQ